MLPDRVSNPEPLTYESGALPIALRGPAIWTEMMETECFIKRPESLCFTYNPFISSAKEKKQQRKGLGRCLGKQCKPRSDGASYLDLQSVRIRILNYKHFYSKKITKSNQTFAGNF